MTEPSDLETAELLRDAYARLRKEMAKAVVGQADVIEQLLMTVFCRGHCLLVGVPGLAKTLMVATLARALKLSFKRIQFTPDLMPSDITGTEVIQDDPVSRRREFKFAPGPVFANVVLADEINRTPPKTQSALLEAMQEGKVSAAGVEHPLPDPFFVLATQNPIEQEGTYPLPEAQLDRFLLMVRVDYPSDAEEDAIMRAGAAGGGEAVEPVLTAGEILRVQRLVRRVPVSDAMYDYARRVVRMSRPGREGAAAFAAEHLTWGAGPRASTSLILAAKARALLAGSDHVAPEDVRAVAPAVLRHRLILNFAARGEGVTPDDVIARLLEAAR